MAQGRGKVKNIYPGGNTAQGFYSLYDSALQNLRRLFILKGGPGTGKSTLIRQVGLAMVDRGYDIEFLHCSSDNRSLDGVIIPAAGIGVVDGTAPHIVDPKYPGAVDEIVNLGECWNDEHLRENRESIVEYTTSISGHFGQAYTLLKEARGIEAEWEAIISQAMDFARIDQKTEELLGEIFNRAPQVRHLFAGALTPEGTTNYIENLTEDCERRFILRGAPGSGKSTLIAKAAQEAVKKGFSIELFHCAFDPNSVDMVVIPYLRTAVLDGSPPHLIEPRRPGDRVIDLMEFADKAVLEQQQAELAEKQRQFEEAVQAAVGEIAEAKRLHDQLETFYIEAMDFDELDAVRERMINKVLHLASAK
jgi:chloramphenicol 3-O-phosphotransferase